MAGRPAQDDAGAVVRQMALLRLVLVVAVVDVEVIVLLRFVGVVVMGSVAVIWQGTVVRHVDERPCGRLVGAPQGQFQLLRVVSDLIDEFSGVWREYGISGARLLVTNGRHQ